LHKKNKRLSKYKAVNLENAYLKNLKVSNVQRNNLLLHGR